MKHEKILEQLLAEAKSDPNALGFLVFGSVASGTHHEKSDIDTITVLRKQKPSAGLENKEITLGVSPVELPFNSVHLSYNKLMADFSHLASTGSDPELRILADYNVGIIYMHFHRWSDAIEQFKKATLKSESGIGIGSVFYRMAQCYQKLGFNREALAYYKEAMSYKNNTLHDNDGPLVAPLAERNLSKIER